MKKQESQSMDLPEFKNGRAIILPDGSEVLDPRPVALPVGFERPPSIQELIRRLITDRQIQEDLEASDAETFDEADDFNIPDDDIPPSSPHEETFDPEHLLATEMELRAGARSPAPPAHKTTESVSLSVKDKNTAVVVGAVDNSPKIEKQVDK